MKALKFSSALKAQLSKEQIAALGILRGFIPISTPEEAEKEIAGTLKEFPELCDMVENALDRDLKSVADLIKRREAEKVVSTIDSRIGTALTRLYEVCSV